MAELMVIEVKEILYSDKSNKDLAEIYEVSPVTISRIRHGKIWQHVEGPRIKSGDRFNNKTGVRGVSLSNTTGRYIAQVTSNGIRHPLGYFDTIEEAAEALTIKRKELGIT